MYKPWGDTDKIGFAYQFGDELASMVPELENLIGASVEDCATSRTVRSDLFGIIRALAQARKIGEYNLAEEMGYLLNRILETKLNNSIEVTNLFYKDGLFQREKSV